MIYLFLGYQQQTKQTMKFTSLLKIHYDPVTSNKLIEFEDFFTFLTKSGDCLQRKSFNRSLRTFQGGAIKLFENKECATIKSVLRYISSYDSLNGSKKLLKIIEQEITCDDTSLRTSSFELYKLIANML